MLFKTPRISREPRHVVCLMWKQKRAAVFCFFFLASAVQRWVRNKNRRRLSDCQVALTWTWQFSGFVCDGGECDCALLMWRHLRKQNVGIINRQERILSVTATILWRMVEGKTPVVRCRNLLPRDPNFQLGFLSSALYLFLFVHW